MQHVWSTYLDSSEDVASLSAKRFGENGFASHHRRSSVASHAYSVASSSRHLNDDILINPQTAPFSAPLNLDSPRDPALTPAPSYNGLAGPGSNLGNSTPLSLSVNYLPSKFSRPLSPSGIHKRKNVKGGSTVLPKQGGGREAFGKSEARMPGENDDDYDGVDGGFFGGKKKRRLRWNKFKIILFATNLCLSVYSLIALIFCLLTFFNVWSSADVVRVSNRTELVVSTIASCLGIVTSLIGWSGILLNNRSFLAVYTLLLWICFAFLVAPGYITYKQRTFNLEGKLNALWSRGLGLDGRLRVQNQLQCCGYFSPFVEATVSQNCYARSILPGCKMSFMTYERVVLARWYTVSFALVPLHIGIIIAALLCSNHITYRFGKGMTPKAYRLNLNSMAVIMDSYANQLAEQLGTDAANDLLLRSKSNLHLDTTMPYSQNPNTSYTPNSTTSLAPSATYSEEYPSRI